MTIRQAFNAVYTWIGQRTFFKWPGWFSETLSGLVTTALAVGILLLLPLWAAALVVAILLSLVYETLIDPNGWSVEDVALRMIGIGLAVAALFVAALL